VAIKLCKISILTIDILHCLTKKVLSEVFSGIGQLPAGVSALYLAKICHYKSIFMKIRGEGGFSFFGFFNVTHD